MKLFTVSKDFSFEAAHSLPHLPVGHKCRNVHGHSYRFRVECTGPLDARGFVVDFAEISAAVKPIVERIDHRESQRTFSVLHHGGKYGGVGARRGAQDAAVCDERRVF